MSKFCGNCGAELRKNGICPNCDAKKKKKSKKAFVIIFVLIIIIGTIATVLLNCKSTEVASGNVSNDGLVCAYKGTVYYSLFSDGLYCENSDGKSELIKSGTFNDLNLDGKFLYFVESQSENQKYFVHKMNLSNKEIETVYTTDDQIIGLWKIGDVYYCNLLYADDSDPTNVWGIYKTDSSFKKLEKVYCHVPNYIYKDRLYFALNSGIQYGEFETINSISTTIFQESNCEGHIIYFGLNDSLYFSSVNSEYDYNDETSIGEFRFWKYDINKGEYIEILKDITKKYGKPPYMNTDGKKLYFTFQNSTSNNKADVYCADLAGNNCEFVETVSFENDCDTYFINIVGDTLYISPRWQPEMKKVDKNSRSQEPAFINTNSNEKYDDANTEETNSVDNSNSDEKETPVTTSYKVGNSISVNGYLAKKQYTDKSGNNRIGFVINSISSIHIGDDRVNEIQICDDTQDLLYTYAHQMVSVEGVIGSGNSAQHTTKYTLSNDDISTVIGLEDYIDGCTPDYDYRMTITDNSSVADLQEAIKGRWYGINSYYIFYENGTCKMLFDDSQPGTYEITSDKRLKINLDWNKKNLEWNSDSLNTRKGWCITSDERLIIEGIELKHSR